MSADPVVAEVSDPVAANPAAYGPGPVPLWPPRGPRGPDPLVLHSDLASSFAAPPLRAPLNNTLNVVDEEAQKMEARRVRFGEVEVRETQAQASSDPAAASSEEQEAPPFPDADYDADSIDSPPVLVPVSRCKCVVVYRPEDVAAIGAQMRALDESNQMLVLAVGEEVCLDLFRLYPVSIHDFHMKVYKIDEAGSLAADANIALSTASKHGFDWLEYVFSAPGCSNESLDLESIGDIFDKFNSSAVICCTTQSIGTWSWLWEHMVAKVIFCGLANGEEIFMQAGTDVWTP